MNGLQVFNNPSFGEIRTIEEGSKVLFCGVDVARALGYSNPSKAISDHCRYITKREVGVRTGMKADGTPSFQTFNMNFISEGDLYRITAASELPAAVAFESWIFDKVIPSIRKHGMYAKDELLENPDLLIAVATQLKKEREQRKALESKVEQDAPKVLFADAVATSHTSILTGELAKLLKQNGVDIGQNRLFSWLRENGYLIRRKGSDYNMPTQRSMELGLFEVKERTINEPNGSTRIIKTPKVTGKGQQYFISKFLAEGGAGRLKNSKLRTIGIGGLLAALYVVTTWINPFGYGMVQLRISAVISMLPFFRQEYRLPCIAAVAIANLFSPLGVIDVAVGIVLWTLAYYGISHLRNIWVICVACAVLSGVLIGGELSFVLKAPFAWNFVSITISQMIVFILGASLWPRVLAAAKR